MTTTITVKANHGWPVRVTQIDPTTGTAISPAQVVPANTERDFVVHSSADLKVHEIQPGEPDYTKPEPESQEGPAEGVGPEDPTAAPSDDDGA